MCEFSDLVAAILTASTIVAMAKGSSSPAKGEVVVTAPSRTTTHTTPKSCTIKEGVDLEGDKTPGSPRPTKAIVPSSSRRATEKNVAIDSVEAGKRFELSSNRNVTNKSDSRDPEVASQLLRFTILPNDIIDRIEHTDREEVQSSAIFQIVQQYGIDGLRDNLQKEVDRLEKALSDKERDRLVTLKKTEEHKAEEINTLKCEYRRELRL
ncbi:hypothetical protein CRG98_005293 [Punica granatum]|uniref:Uncharacterized protein n=1 Tax=Punica granatum TaxID=22663 RepID=A0A2I0L0R7_PUNGR|nr:hypothetical protein CRG98_005293 [Punica granatum]